MFDGIQRPLQSLQEVAGDFLTKGAEVKNLNREKLWDFVPVAKVGDEVVEGDIVGTVQETEVINHKIMVPIGVSGRIKRHKEWKFPC